MTAHRDERDGSSQFDIDQNELNRVPEPEHFENADTPARPQSKSGLPDIEQAEVAHYAYDPQTYEILCRPGQKLSQKKAQRLQELGFYEHVVTFAE